MSTEGRHKPEARKHLVDEFQPRALAAGGIDAADDVRRRDFAHVGVDVTGPDRAPFGNRAVRQAGQQTGDSVHAVVAAGFISRFARCILQHHGAYAAVSEPGHIFIQRARAEGQALVGDFRLMFGRIKDVDADHGRGLIQGKMAVDEFLQAVVAKMVGIPAQSLRGLVVAVEQPRFIDGAGRAFRQGMHRGRAHGEDDGAVHRAGGQQAGGLLGRINAVTVSAHASLLSARTTAS